ncbi:MAG: glutaredoxin domain-containing protein [Nanoarchaeota archaeon]|nr:glutaredoxin domain-containing protein [Nanoarchaeota archaeon]
MGITKIEAYVKPTCKDSKEMVNFLKTLNIPSDVIDITTPEGYMLSKDIELYMLPTVFLKDEKNGIVDTAFCVDAVKRILGQGVR